MARNTFEDYIEELEIRKANFLQKQQEEYKLNRLKKCLEVLKRANIDHTVPSDIMVEIELIFELMPSHDLYYIKKDEVLFLEYIKEVNSLFIRVFDNYEKYIEEPDNFFKTLFTILYPILLILVFYYEQVEKRIGLELTILVSFGTTIVLIYINRRKLWNSYFRFE
ncbi:MAG: hypothetical protein V4585_12275 [Bacteroidota bacterium]|jgi:hypothetical protein